MVSLRETDTTERAEQPSTVGSQLRLDNVAAEPAHARKRSRLVDADHRRVADDVGCEDSSETAAYVTGTHSPEPARMLLAASAHEAQ